MTTTIPTQMQTIGAADDLQIITTPPTVADAQLLVQMQMADSVSGANRGWALLRDFDTPPTLSQLRKRHPKASEEYHNVTGFLGSCETLATFVKNGLLNEALVNDLYWVAGAWTMAEKVCKGLRKEAGEARIFENFEWLARRAT